MERSTFELEKMYEFVSDFAEEHNLRATINALPFAREKHEGQVRKSKEGSKLPYITHPLTMACHAIAMGFADDELFAALLLHDVVEDCGVSPASLPVNLSVQNAVLLVTRQDGESKAKYYQQIGENPIAVMVKLIDRCHNVSQMSLAFSRENYGNILMKQKAIFCLCWKMRRRNGLNMQNNISCWNIKSVVNWIR